MAAHEDSRVAWVLRQVASAFNLTPDDVVNLLEQDDRLPGLDDIVDVFERENPGLFTFCYQRKLHQQPDGKPLAGGRVYALTLLSGFQRLKCL
jgi:hypothetical protein